MRELPEIPWPVTNITRLDPPVPPGGEHLAPPAVAWSGRSILSLILSPGAAPYQVEERRGPNGRPGGDSWRRQQMSEHASARKASCGMASSGVKLMPAPASRAPRRGGRSATDIPRGFRAGAAEAGAGCGHACGPRGAARDGQPVPPPRPPAPVTEALQNSASRRQPRRVRRTLSALEPVRRFLRHRYTTVTDPDRHRRRRASTSPCGISSFRRRVGSPSTRDAALGGPPCWWLLGCASHFPWPDRSV